MMYCGTSSARSRTSVPPTISTATSAIAPISAQVRMPPSAEVSAEVGDVDPAVGGGSRLVEGRDGVAELAVHR